MDISKNAGVEVLVACYGNNSFLNLFGKLILTPFILFLALIWFILDAALTKKPRT